MYTLIVKWFDGSVDEYSYNNEDAAITAADNMKMALGNQISWTGIRRI